MRPENKRLVCTVIPRIRYSDAYNLQQRLFSIIYKDKVNINFLLLLEHDNVITLGRNAQNSNLLVGKEILDRKGIELIETDRGGDITYHGPGQIVGYPIIQLKELRYDVKSYVRMLEELMIQVSADFQIRANRVEGLTGAWVGTKKIGSIGVRVQRWITLHGFAYNISTDLNLFKLIIPCGIQGKEMTSVNELSGRTINIQDVFQTFITKFSNITNLTPKQIPYSQLLKLLEQPDKKVSFSELWS